MGCYECGSDNGDAFRLCPECVAHNQVSHRQSKAAMIGENKSQRRDAMDVLARNWKIHILIIVFIYAAAFAVIYMRTGRSHVAYAASHAGLMLSTVVAVLTWVYLWLAMLVENFVLAIIFIFLAPVLIIWHLMFGLEEHKWPVLAHAAALIGFVGCLLLTRVLQLKPH